MSFQEETYKAVQTAPIFSTVLYLKFAMILHWIQKQITLIAFRQNMPLYTTKCYIFENLS